MGKTLVALLMLATPSICLPQSQEKPKPLPGGFAIYGPVHTIRDERALMTQTNGDPVEGPRALVMTATFNEDGTKQERTFYDNGTIFRRIEETYDPGGRLVERRRFRGGKDLESRAVSTYDNLNRLVEQIEYRPDDSISRRTVYHRDEKESQTETFVYDAKGRLIIHSSTHNDFQTHRASSITVNPGGVNQIEASSVRNEDGSQEFQSEDSKGSFQRQLFRFDGKGGEDRISYNKDGTIKIKERFIREFDSYHNMIKTTHLVADGDSQEFKPADISYRTITYYGQN
jgi:antitoxin component YwqK of YwqJK toxin-antitoxin module